MSGERIIHAAGGIVWRRRTMPGRIQERGAKPSLEILLIHRPSYDDWTFPKGKLDAGESVQAAAVREIVEETDLRVRLGTPLRRISYPVATGTKTVDYWVARSVGQGDAGPFVANKEVDRLRWVGLPEAAQLLTYDHDRDVLDTFGQVRDRNGHRTRTLILLRHGKAAPHTDSVEDMERPLTSTGAARAAALVPVLAAYGIRRVVSSPAVRCAQTLEPYAHSIGTFLEIDDRLAEDTRPALVQRSISALMERKRPVVLCSHRPTLPWIFEAIGTEAHDLATGEAVVVHHRKGAVVATETLR